MKTIVDWIYHWAKKKPTKAAIVYDGNTVTYGQLAALVEATRRHLETRGVASPPPGHPRPTAVIAIDSILDAWVVLIAARSMGFDTLCVRSIEGVLVNKFKNIGCILVSEEEGKRLKVADSFEDKNKIIEIPRSAYDLHGIATMAMRSPAATPGGNVLVSSGTTGVPKCVMVGPENEPVIAETYARHARLTASSRSYVLDYALSAFGGYVYGLSSFQIGATLIIHQNRRFLQTFYNSDFDYVTLRPSHIDELFDPAARQFARPKQRVRLHIGGGFVNFRKIEWILQNVTPNVFHIYGATENSAFAKTKIVTEDDLLWHQIYPHRRVEIVDDRDAPVRDGVEGKLRVKSESYTAHEYLDDPPATAACFRGGYFYTGDLAVRRADGRIRILGRVFDVLFIKSDKFTVGPIEAEVQGLVGCLNACVFARQNDNTQDEILIGLEMDREPSAHQLKALRDMFHMVDDVLVTSIPAFPTTEGGKVDRSTLRQMLCDARDQTLA